MLLRSVAFDRVLTIGVSLALVVGARAAMRQKTWGLLLSLAASTWFAAAFALGMAPPFFLVFALLGAMPLFKSWRALAEFDRGAAVVAAGMATSAGAGLALAWKMFAPWLFWNLPALRPTFQPGHGLALAAITATATVLALRDRKLLAEAKAREAESAPSEEPAVRHRVGAPVRVETTESAVEDVSHEAEHLEEEPAEAVERRRRQV